MIDRINLIKLYKPVINRRYNIIYLIYFCFFLSNGPIEKIIPIMFDDSGISETIYGTFLSVNNGLHIFLPIFISFLSTRFSPYFIAIAGMFISFLASFCISVLNINAAYAILLSIMIIAGRTIFNYSIGNTINYQIDKENRGKYFALRDLFLFGSISLGLYLGGILVDIINIKAVYFIFSFGFLLVIIPIKQLNKSFKDKALGTANVPEKNTIIRKYTLIDYFYLFRDKKLIAFIIINLCTIIYNTSMNFLPLLGTKLGISVPDVMSIFAVLTISNSIIALFLGQFSDSKGRKWIYVFDLFFDVFPALVFAFTNSLLLFITGIFLTMIKDALAPISFAYYYDCFPENDGVLIYGFLSSFSNALGLLVPIFVALLWVKSSKFVFLIASLGNIIAAVVAALMLPNVKNTKSKI